MPYCPGCRQEYEQGNSRCVDCGADLVQGVMPERPAEGGLSEEKWAVLMRVRRQETAGIISGLLENSGIECEIVGKGFTEVPVPAVESLAKLEI